MSRLIRAMRRGRCRVDRGNATDDEWSFPRCRGDCRRTSVIIAHLILGRSSRARRSDSGGGLSWGLRIVSRLLVLLRVGVRGVRGRERECSGRTRGLDSACVLLLRFLVSAVLAFVTGGRRRRRGRSGRMQRGRREARVGRAVFSRGMRTKGKLACIARQHTEKQNRGRGEVSDHTQSEARPEGLLLACSN